MLGDHYRIKREIGQGGMASVYLCVDIRTEEHVAVKVLRPELAGIVTRERFFREIAFASELDHPRIPRVIESGISGELPFYSMEFVEGESLRDRLRREPQIPVAEAVRIATEIAKPMSYAHARGLVHRDIKPENILLRGDDVFVLDFGVARAIEGAAGERLTRTGIALGTPAYMSPEQLTADRDLDYRSDVFSFGCVVYEMLAGTPPFGGATPQILMASRATNPPRPLRIARPGLPESVETAVITAMAHLPDDRFQSVDEFADALRLPIVAEEAKDAFESSAGDELLTKLKESFRELYEVQEEIKGGGMSRLFLAKDLSLNRLVVIKILPPELVSQMMLARFKRESEVTARLQHPHILPVISAGVRDGLVHYIMPFIDGESLRGRIGREQHMPMNEALRLLREVTDALSYAHKNGIIHRDLKPENILIQDGHAVLADFGIAAALSSDKGETATRLTGTGMSLGTVGYMAPEQALGERNVDARADIYALGVIAYEMMAGAPPFIGATDQAILVAHLTREVQSVDVVREDTPPQVAQAIKRAMAKDPAMRFQTAAEFRDALEPVAGGVSGPTLSTRIRRLRRLPTRVTLGVPIALAAVAAALYLTNNVRRSSAAPEALTIAIAPFNALTAGLELWREGLVDVLARNLDGAGPFRTVSPTVAIKGFPLASDRKSASDLARRTNAQYAIFGTVVGSANDSVRLRATLVNIQTDRAWDYEGRDSTVEAAAAQFTVAVLAELGKTHRIGAVRQSSFGSTSIDAMRAFLQGEQFYRRTSWDSAATAYARAVAFDSRFAIALRRAAQVTGWQRNEGDSVARAFRLAAGAANRGLSPRDSLLIAADSQSAAVARLPSDSMNWAMLKRLFSTVDEAARRYPDDPEVWYSVGEARFHQGYGSPVKVTERESLEAFDKSIALDSAFAPAYVHAVELAFTLDGAKAGLRYAGLYLRLRPTDDEAEGIAIVNAVADGSSPNASDSVLDGASSDAIMAAYYTVRRWPDSAQTALRLLQSTGRRPRTSPTYVSDSVRLWNFLPLQLAYRGRLSEAYLALGNRPSRIFAELALLGGIPADTAAAVFSRWVKDGLPQAFHALPWLAARRDSLTIKTLMSRADANSGRGSGFETRGARYRAASTRAYLSLARQDTADALKRFVALRDTLCIACYLDRLTAARLLAARGKLAEADSLLGQRINSLVTPAEVLIAMERGRVAKRRGRNAEATRAFRLVVDAWSTGDQALQPMVAEARRELAALLK